MAFKRCWCITLLQHINLLTLSIEWLRTLFFYLRDDVWGEMSSFILDFQLQRSFLFLRKLIWPLWLKLLLSVTVQKVVRLKGLVYPVIRSQIFPLRPSPYWTKMSRSFLEKTGNENEKESGKVSDHEQWWHVFADYSWQTQNKTKQKMFSNIKPRIPDFRLAQRQGKSYTSCPKMSKIAAIKSPLAFLSAKWN